MKIQFVRGEKTPTAEIVDGMYKRTFNRREQPFEVTPEEWVILAQTGLFEPTAEKKNQEDNMHLPPAPPEHIETPGNTDQK